MLFWIVFLPILGGLVGWLVEAFLRRSFTQVKECRIEHKSHISLLNKIHDEFCYFSAGWIALFIMCSTLLIACILGVDALIVFNSGEDWLLSIDYEWIPLFGIQFHLVMDGLSILMIILTIIIVIIAILYSRKEMPSSSGLFYFCLLFMASSVIMLFVAVDLFLWFFLWEAVVIPLYFLITLWGRRDSNTQLRINGASKFLIYTQVSSLIMLIAIIFLALANWQLTNQWTFNYYVLIKTPISSYIELLVMLGFLIAFIVRLPLIPFHNWFIDAHIESSTTGSIMISGLLANTAIYGLLRFVIPLFPNASLTIAPFMMLLSLITLLYSALLCFSQSDIKRLIAYIHIALINLCVAMIYSGSIVAYQGIILQIISVTLVIVGLFIISGLLAERYSTRNITRFSGLKAHVKYLSTLTLFFILAILGMPGTANFVSYFMMLLGSYENSACYTILVILGLILLSVSIIVRIQPIFYGVVDKPKLNKQTIPFKDLFVLIGILFVIFFIGLYPQWIFDLSDPSINKIQQIISSAQSNLIKGDV